MLDALFASGELVIANRVNLQRILWRNRIVGRADLKSERKEGALVVKAFHLEPGVRRSAALDEAFERALDRLRRTAGLERVAR